MLPVRSAVVALTAATLLAACIDTPIPTSPIASPPNPTAPSATTGKGWIVGRGGLPTEVTFSVIDGMAIFEGDILLGRADEVAKTREELLGRHNAQGPSFGVVRDGFWFRWGGGYMPYVIDGTFSPSQRATIEAAITHVNSSTWGVNMTPRTSENRWVRFVLSDACNSSVGRQDYGGQPINLSASCAGNMGSIAHEILHALGMHHEQSRCDRDSFVTIQWNNIQSDKQYNFEKQCNGYTDLFSYDETSVMHYPPFNSFAIDFSQPTITSNRGFPLSEMGRQEQLSNTDSWTLNQIYAPRRPSMTVTYPGNVPTIWWYATGAASVTIKYIQQYEEWNVETQQFSSYVVMEYVVAESSSSPIEDPYNSYTGTNRCRLWENENGNAEYIWYYEITANYAYPTPSPPPERYSPSIGTC